jgi:WD40 repeat protein
LSEDRSTISHSSPANPPGFHPIDGGKPATVLGRHRLGIRSLCFNPAGNLLASASEDHTVKLWKVHGEGDSITLLGHTARLNSVAFSPEGELIASGGDDETVRIWEVRTGQVLMVLRPQVGPICSLAFSPDGRRLAVGSALGNPSDDSCPVLLYELTTRKEKQLLIGHEYMVTCLAFHPTQSFLASGSGDTSILAWDLQTGQHGPPWKDARNQPVSRLAYAPKGDLLAVGWSRFFNTSPKGFAVDLREADTGKVRRQLNGPTNIVAALAFDPSGSMLAGGTVNGAVFVWDV